MWDVWDVKSPSSSSSSSSSSRSQHVHTTGDGTSKGLRIPRLELRVCGFSFLTCTTAGTRSHCHIVATLGSSSRQQTLIVGGLTVLRRGSIAVIPRGVRTTHTIYTVLGTSREPIGSLLVAS